MKSQAVETPVVAFNTGGVGEGVEHGETGLLSPERAIEPLAENLFVLLTSDTLRERFCEAEVGRARTLFNIKTQCQTLEKIYRQLCKVDNVLACIGQQNCLLCVTLGI